MTYLDLVFDAAAQNRDSPTGPKPLPLGSIQRIQGRNPGAPTYCVRKDGRPLNPRQLEVMCDFLKEVVQPALQDIAKSDLGQHEQTLTPQSKEMFMTHWKKWCEDREVAVDEAGEGQEDREVEGGSDAEDELGSSGEMNEAKLAEAKDALERTIV